MLVMPWFLLTYATPSSLASGNAVAPNMMISSPVYHDRCSLLSFFEEFEHLRPWETPRVLGPKGLHARLSDV